MNYSGLPERQKWLVQVVALAVGYYLAERMLAYEQILRGGAGLFAASQSVERNEWRDYVRQLRIEKNFPGIQGIAYAQRIMPEEKDAHIRQVQAEGFPGYSIRPEGECAEYNSIVYMEPFNGRNLRAFGYDMLTEPVRRAAMLHARDSGDTAVSGKVTLVQETTQDVQAGFVMYVPVYHNGAPSGTVEERRAALTGFVASAFRVNDWMHGILGSAAQPVAVEIFDGRATVAGALMYDSEAGRAAAPAGVAGAGVAATFTAQSPLKIEDHDWILRFTALPAFEAGSGRQKAQIVLAGGMIVSLLFFYPGEVSRRHPRKSRGADPGNDRRDARI